LCKSNVLRKGKGDVCKKQQATAQVGIPKYVPLSFWGAFYAKTVEAGSDQGMISLLYLKI